MKQRTRFGLFLITLLQCVMCSISAGENSPAEVALPLRLGIAGAPSGVRAEIAQAFADELSLDGRFTVSVSPDPDPEAEETIYDAVSGGVTDIALVDARVLGMKNPRLAILDQPFMFFMGSQAALFLNGVGGERIRTLVGQDGIDVVGWLQIDNARLFAEKPLSAPDDFQGVQVVGPVSRGFVTAITALGGTAVPMSLEQGVQAVRDGTANAIACHTFDLQGVEDLPDVLTNATMIGYDLPFFAVCVSRGAWSRIPEELRPGFQSAVNRAINAAAETAGQADSRVAGELGEKNVSFDSADTGALRETVWPSIRGLLSSVDPELMQETEKAAVPITIW